MPKPGGIQGFEMCLSHTGHKCSVDMREKRRGLAARNRNGGQLEGPMSSDGYLSLR